MCKVSFIVTAYNLEQYIERCINSLINQTMQDIEIIVVNDGSTDSTTKIMDKLAKEDSRIKNIYQENSGVSEARLRGVHESTGEYIIFIDGDDWVSNELAQNTYFIASNNNYDIICFDYYNAYDNNVIKEKHNNINKEVFEFEYLELILEQKINHELWNKLIKKEFIEKTNYNNISNIGMGEDLAINVEFGVNRPKVRFIEGMYYYYYQRQGSAMHRFDKNSLDIVKSLNYIELTLKEHNILDKYEKYVEFLEFIHLYVNHLLFQTEIINDIHKKFYYSWKEKHVIIRKNELCKKYIKSNFNRKIKLLFIAFNCNYYIGCSLVRLKRLIKR